MPRWVRIVLSGWFFFLFFSGSPLLGIVILPLMRLFAKDRDDHRRRCTRLIQRLFRVFTAFCHFARLIEPPREMPALTGIAPGQPYVLITNHPSLIDIFFLLGGFDGMTCVAKGSWYRSLVLGPLLRQTSYLPGPGSGQEETAAVREGGMLTAMVEHLEQGHPLLVFPEGTRSTQEHLHRFRRGAVEAAIRAKVPIVALFVAIDRPYLMKGVPFWKVPKDMARYSIERLDIIDTSGLDVSEAKALNADLQARFHARFARLLVERAESRVLAAEAEQHAAA
ncbi:MAG: 1-acyl-sn-glycerol-3-phosphate acyltransferase [Myxococcota bacterium]|nr:1-acyl-sn-glycerol-3-phosphate acyltransferase [Myxococcota bacterium]